MALEGEGEPYGHCITAQEASRGGEKAGGMGRCLGDKARDSGDPMLRGIGQNNDKALSTGKVTDSERELSWQRGQSCGRGPSTATNYVTLGR